MKRLIPLVLLCFSIAANAATKDLYVFANAIQRQQFFDLTHQLRCLVCQNQNLADSTAPLAADLRKEIQRQIQLGINNEEIIDYLVKRYGNFILYKPRFNAQTAALWLMPLVLLLLAIVSLCWVVNNNKLRIKEYKS